MKKRIEWVEYFAGLAKLTAKRSADPNTQVGAVVVNKNKRIIGLGYNGMPSGIEGLPWSREAESIKDTKYPYVIHAEINALLNTDSTARESEIYVTLFPCSNCSKFIVQAGVKKIFYIGDKYQGTEDDDISKFILNKAGVVYNKIEDIDFNQISWD